MYIIYRYMCVRTCEDKYTHVQTNTHPVALACIQISKGP